MVVVVVVGKVGVGRRTRGKLAVNRTGSGLILAGTKEPRLKLAIEEVTGGWGW